MLLSGRKITFILFSGAYRMPRASSDNEPGLAWKHTRHESSGEINPGEKAISLQIVQLSLRELKCNAFSVLGCTVAKVEKSCTCERHPMQQPVCLVPTMVWSTVVRFLHTMYLVGGCEANTSRKQESDRVKGPSFSHQVSDFRRSLLCRTFAYLS